MPGAPSLSLPTPPSQASAGGSSPTVAAELPACQHGSWPPALEGAEHRLLACSVMGTGARLVGAGLFGLLLYSLRTELFVHVLTKEDLLQEDEGDLDSFLITASC